MIEADLRCVLLGTDEVDAEAEAGGEEPAARAGDAVEANGGAVQRIEVDVHAQAWLADVEHDRETRADMIEQILAAARRRIRRYKRCLRCLRPTRRKREGCGN